MNETSRKDFISSVFLLLLHRIIPLSFCSINHSHSSSKITSLSNSLMSFFGYRAEHGGYNADPGARSRFTLLSAACFCLWLQIPRTPVCSPQFPEPSRGAAGGVSAAAPFTSINVSLECSGDPGVSAWTLLGPFPWKVQSGYGPHPFGASSVTVVLLSELKLSFGRSEGPRECSPDGVSQSLCQRMM